MADVYQKLVAEQIRIKTNKNTQMKLLVHKNNELIRSKSQHTRLKLVNIQLSRSEVLTTMYTFKDKTNRSTERINKKLLPNSIFII